ncbi:MAG: type II toxin-antitoxin system Phd/YefM family antitoxin [bacterium]
MKPTTKESIVPLTTFRRQTAEIIRKVKENGFPIILTQNGNAAAVLLDPHTYDELVSLAEKAHNAEIVAAIERSRKAAKEGKVREHERVMRHPRQAG